MNTDYIKLKSYYMHLMWIRTDSLMKSVNSKRNVTVSYKEYMLWSKVIHYGSI